MDAMPTDTQSTAAASSSSSVNIRQPWWLPPWLVRHRRTIAAVALALGGAWLGLVAAGTSSGFVGPLAVDATVHPAFNGRSVIEVDPIGSLELDTHTAPVAIDIAVRSVDRDGVEDIVDDPTSLNQLDERIVDDLTGLLIRAAVRAALVAIAGGILASLLVLRSVRHVLIAAATATAAVVGTYGLAAMTYNPEAVQEPKYTGLLEVAPEVVGSAEDIAANFDAYADQLASIVTNVGVLYNTTLSLPTFSPNDDTIRVLHVSDLHLNPAAWDVINAVADQYDVGVIVDSGDIADHGTALENAYVEDIGKLGRPYVFVKGNHDSPTTAAAVAAQPNATVLNGEPADIAGLRFLGAPDPRFTPDQTTRGTVHEDLLAGTEELAETAGDLDPPADVTVYHDPTDAELLDGTTPLVLSGHRHKRETYTLDQGTRVMVQGSTGGAGLRALEKEEPTPIMLSVLYFDPDSKQLLAWDDLTLGGFGLSSARIERHQADEEEGLDEDATTPPATQSP